MSHKNCITLRQFLETYYKDECEVCQKTIREIIKILGLKENDLVYVTYIYCCTMAEGGSCPIPLPCPSELYFIEHCTTWFSKPIKEYWCIRNMLNDKENCYEIEADREMRKCESEYASSAEEAMQLLKRFGLSEEIARKLIQDVQ